MDEGTFKSSWRSLGRSIENELRTGPGKINAYVGVVLLAIVALLAVAVGVKAVVNSVTFEVSDVSVIIGLGGWEAVALTVLFLAIALAYWILCLWVFETHRSSGDERQ